jgi:class 3 adenylate cyclase
MGPASLYLKDPSTSRFVGGDQAEAESLLGAPLPALPRPEDDGTGELYLVRFHPRLRTLLQRFLQGLLGQIGGEAVQGRGEAAGRDQDEYEAALVRLLASVRQTDRRQGVTNLFWLAHSLDAALALRELERRNAAVKKLKYSLHPLLSSFYRRVERTAQAEGNGAACEPPAGWLENAGLVDALIDDGFAFTEVSIGDLDFNQYLASNKRYRLSAEVFFEIHALLLRETERRLREGDRGLLQRAARHVPRLPREQYGQRPGATKLMLNAQVMSYLFADAWSAGGAAAPLPRLRAEAERRKPGEIMDVFLDLVCGMKRFEIVAHLRDRVRLLDAFAGDRGIEEKVSRGFRVFEFGDAASIMGNAVNATVMFLDLRGFTRTSEGQISEGDLTRELYKVFDPFMAVLRRFSGTVDKFLGDGIMVTFGTERSDPLAALNALRSAILCQETLGRLRQEGQTHFHMGVAIHYGRVYLARFMGGDGSVHATVIGRNVNLAGRLSASGKPIDDDSGRLVRPIAPASASGLSVRVDGDGTLSNQGIALSQDTLAQLEAHLPLRFTDAGWVYYDEAIGRRILVRYVGDAKFKGVRSTFPVYDVDYEA